MYTLCTSIDIAKEFCYIDVLKKHIHRESYSEERSINTTWIWHLHNKEHTSIQHFLHKSILFKESTRAIWNLNAPNLVFMGLRKARWKKSIYSWFLFDLILGIYGLLRAFLTPSSMCWSKIWQVWRAIDPKVGRHCEETLDFSPVPMKYGGTCGLLWMCTSIHPCIQFWVKAHAWGKSISRPLS